MSGSILLFTTILPVPEGSKIISSLVTVPAIVDPDISKLEPFYNNLINKLYKSLKHVYNLHS